MRAAVINSGNANACTGAQGEVDALRMVEVVERALGQAAGTALVMSTGVIGVALPMDEIEAGIGEAAVQAGRRPAEQGRTELAAKAIMTTDTQPKLASSASALRHPRPGQGAAMIHPNMATMLGFVLTDAAVGRTPAPRPASAADRSFNGISVDGEPAPTTPSSCWPTARAGPVDAGAFEAVASCVPGTGPADRARRRGRHQIRRRAGQGRGNEDEARQVAKTIATRCW